MLKSLLKGFQCATPRTRVLSTHPTNGHLETSREQFTYPVDAVGHDEHGGLDMCDNITCLLMQHRVRMQELV
eukprot:6183722-Pyramimonas_sp.AAC.2